VISQIGAGREESRWQLRAAESFLRSW